MGKRLDDKDLAFDVPDDFAKQRCAGNGAKVTAVYTVLVGAEDEEHAVGSNLVDLLDGDMTIVGTVKDDNIAAPDPPCQCRRGNQNVIAIIILRP